MTRRQAKVTKQNLIAIKERFASFLDGKTNIPADEALKNAVRSYHESFLCSDRVAKMVCINYSHLIQNISSVKITLQLMKQYMNVKRRPMTF